MTMKRIIMMMTVALVSVIAMAKDIKTMVITPQPRLVCENCENKVKGNLRFVKGVKEITTNLDKQTIEVKYDADKTSEEKILTALSKIGYTPKCEGTKCEGTDGSCCKSQEAKSCCKE